MKKIYFAKLFIVSILIMIINNIVNLFDNAPDFFKYGDSLFHFLQNILSIINQLASSTAAAVIFYYCVEFLNKNKELDKYRDFRSDLYHVLYSYLESTKNIKGFEVFKGRQVKPGDMFTYKDVPIFINLVKSFDTNTIINNISSYLCTSESVKVVEFIRSINFGLGKLINHKNYRYLKNSTEKLQNISDLYEFDLYGSDEFFNNIVKKSINKEEDTRNYILELIDYYIYVLDDIIFLYENTDKFIESIEKRHIWTFITLLD
ncbi:TPA: hypothetical protein K8M77_002011 [Clostridium perfringens]|nr:hypothetical protein [Clostridium perfringens]